MKKTLPCDEYDFKRAVFRFARLLLSKHELVGAKAEDLADIVAEWFERVEHRPEDYTLDDLQADFADAWEKAACPEGTGVFAEALQRVEDGLPAVAERYPDPRMQRLVGICYELQQAAGDEPFFLSCRQAEVTLGVKRKTAWHWLRRLCREKVIEVAEPGDRKRRRATRFRFIWAER